MASAEAAPHLPVPIERTGVDLVGVGSTERAWLEETACVASACSAARVREGLGGEARVRVASVLGAYVSAGATRVGVDAARFNESGASVEGGLLGTVPLADRLGLDAWVGVLHSSSGGSAAASNRAVRTALDVGLALHLGDADDHIVGWLGAGAEPYAVERVTVLGGELTVALSPPVPVDARGGVAFVSEPLGAAWSRRGRLLAGVDASAGYRSSLSAWVGVAL